VDFTSVVETIGKVVDGAGVGVMVIGGCASLSTFARAVAGGMDEAYHHLRRALGRSILLGLELLVAGDIIRTVATTPTFENLGVLAVLVLLRTFLSFTMELEITGRWPWQSPAS
jgi:uncharacterized membrane protein